MNFHKFLYSAPNFLIDAGVSGTLDNDLLWQYVSYASTYINTLTRQFFCDLAEVRYWSGKSNALIHDPTLIPIIAVDNLKLIGERTNMRDYPRPLEPPFKELRGGYSIGDYTYPTDEYVVDDRVIENIHGTFFGGVNNYEVTGVFGWLSYLHTKVETTITADLKTDYTEIAVTSVSGFQPGDVVTFGTNLLRVPFVQIDAVNKKLKFPYAVGAIDTIVSGTSVVSYGAVPEEIKVACNIIAAKFARKFPDLYKTRFQGRLKKEKVDRYSYELFGPDESSEGFIEDEAILKNILSEFQPPPYVGVV